MMKQLYFQNHLIKITVIQDHITNFKIYLYIYDAKHSLCNFNFLRLKINCYITFKNENSNFSLHQLYLIHKGCYLI